MLEHDFQFTHMEDIHAPQSLQLHSDSNKRQNQERKKKTKLKIENLQVMR